MLQKYYEAYLKKGYEKLELNWTDKYLDTQDEDFKNDILNCYSSSFVVDKNEKKPEAINAQ